jgi:hypothetical protein
LLLVEAVSVAMTLTVGATFAAGQREKPLAKQQAAPLIFPPPPNQPEGSRAFAMLPPRRCYHADSGTSGRFVMKPVVRFHMLHAPSVGQANLPADIA